MSTRIVLDTGPLGMVTTPRAPAQTSAGHRWLEGLLARGVRVLILEIVDDELRRELLRAGKVAGLRRLDALVATVEYVPLTTVMMRPAVVLWPN